MDRRRFLAGLAGSAILTLHAQPGGGSDRQTVASTGRARLRHLRLQTAASLAEMRAFYQDALGLPAELAANELTVRAGATRVTFVEAGADVAEPFYHFAFNIPQNKIRAARDWQSERTRLIRAPEHLRDPAYPDDVIDYAHWNAHSIFFWDPGGNLVEHIARHDLPNQRSGPFTSADILCASEIAFVVDDVAAVGQKIRETFGLPRYRNASDQFEAVGDEHGLLLVMRRGRPIGFAEAKPTAVFSTETTVASSDRQRLGLAGFPYEIRAEG